MKDNSCVHFWQISSPTSGQHIIGRCKLCGREVDYTILHEQDQGWRQICLANTLTRPDVDMSNIMKSRTGNGKKPRGRPSKYSRGRVR